MVTKLLFCICYATQSRSNFVEMQHRRVKSTACKEREPFCLPQCVLHEFRMGKMGNKRTIAIIAAFAAIYVIWGSTYLVIRFAIETMPPFLMAGLRFGTAGVVLFVFLKLRGLPLPSPRQMANSAVTGALFLLAGNGGVSWAEQYIPSGIVALMSATIPCWIVLFSVLTGDKKPGIREILALIIGATGVVLLTQSGGHTTVVGTSVPSWVFVILLIGNCSWAIGTVFARRANMPESPFMATAFQMMFGGVFLFLAGLLAGELHTFQPELISLRSGLALAYLIVFGSIIAFSAYVWLLRVVQPSRVASYAYVNPLIAVLLGWLFGNESLSSGTFLAASLVVMAVFLITVTPDMLEKTGKWLTKQADTVRRDKIM